uniref:Uncharacterized protein n=1 Tax=Anopheles coluzzii TaxID=1518534 RepID=A0A8W7Q390_ANOCL
MAPTTIAVVRGLGDGRVRLAAVPLTTIQPYQDGSIGTLEMEENRSANPEREMGTQGMLRKPFGNRFPKLTVMLHGAGCLTGCRHKHPQTGGEAQRSAVTGVSVS